MRKTVMAALVMAAGIFGAQAQSITPRVEVGAAFSNANTKTTSANSTSENIKIGFRAAAAAEIALTDPGMATFYLAPGVTYKMGGFKSKYLTSVSETTHNLSVPVNIGLRANFMDNLGVSVELGPYFSYALSGKAAGDKGASIDIFADGSNRKRFDAGLGISAALELSRFYVRLGSEFGMINQYSKAPEGYTLTQHNFYATVGMRF
ncbi:MAG: porin family protein [Porphyromonadaceae bacterium]|nr:porin family protein [Porphyromonadaceae bacterium]